MLEDEIARKSGRGRGKGDQEERPLGPPKNLEGDEEETPNGMLKEALERQEGNQNREEP